MRQTADVKSATIKEAKERLEELIEAARSGELAKDIPPNTNNSQQFIQARVDALVRHLKDSGKVRIFLKNPLLLRTALPFRYAFSTMTQVTLSNMHATTIVANTAPANTGCMHLWGP